MRFFVTLGLSRKQKDCSSKQLGLTRQTRDLDSKVGFGYWPKGYIWNPKEDGIWSKETICHRESRWYWRYWTNDNVIHGGCPRSEESLWFDYDYDFFLWF